MGYLNNKTMCTVSMIGDHYNDKWKQPDYTNIFSNLQNVTRAEFESLKKEVLEMRELLKKAAEYDKKNNEPNCEMESKVAMLKQIAELFGVDLSEIFKPTE